jgi:hypothetical protein
MKLRFSILLFIGLSFSALAQETPMDYKNILTEEPKNTTMDKKFLVSLSGGLGMRTGIFLDGLSSVNQDFQRKLNFGYQGEFQANYYLKDRWGFGLIASYFGAQSSGKFEQYSPEMNHQHGFDSKQNDMTLYIGPALTGRLFYKKYSFRYSFTAGAHMYNSELTWTDEMGSRSTKVNGLTWSVGTNVQLGYEIMDKMELFACSSYYFGLINQADRTDLGGNKTHVALKNEDRIDISRFSLGIGANYSF